LRRGNVGEVEVDTGNPHSSSYSDDYPHQSGSTGAIPSYCGSVDPNGTAFVPPTAWTQLTMRVASILVPRSHPEQSGLVSLPTFPSAVLEESKKRFELHDPSLRHDRGPV
jgi:hypothetical protein